MYLASFFTHAAIALVKIAILLLYAQIFPIPKFKIVFWLVIGLVSIWGNMCLIVSDIFFNTRRRLADTYQLCTVEADPISASWTYQCTFRFDPVKLAMCEMLGSLIFDITVLCLPLPLVVRLKMPTTRKFAIAGISWLGSLYEISYFSREESLLIPCRCVVYVIARIVVVRRTLQKEATDPTAICKPCKYCCH
jgi:hypothetical protein